MLPLNEFYSINEGDKGSLYADRMIRFIRMNMQPLVSVAHAKTGLDYLLGQQDMGVIEDLFQDPSQMNLGNAPVNGGGLVDQYQRQIGGNPQQRTGSHDNIIRKDMRNVLFKSLPILIKAKNIICAEMKKMGVVVNVRASDPTSSSKRHNDEAVIKNRKYLESMLTYMYTSIGEKPPVKLSEYSSRFGERHDSGNSAEFDKMSLSDTDPDDIGFFFDNFYKLDWEIEMEKVIDAIMSFNEVGQNNIERWVIDILSKNAGACQQYVSDDNGALVIDYLTPETVSIYGGGRRKDYNDAMAKCYEQNVTIKQFLDRVGSAFNFETDLDDLMLAVYYASSGSIDVTGINPDFKGDMYGDDWYCQGRDNSVRYTHSQFMNFKVCLGYMEWTSQNYTEYGESLKKKAGEFDNAKSTKEANKKRVGYKQQNEDGTPTEDNQPADGKKYPTKARYECPTYKSYYLALTSQQHIKYKFGKQTYQDIKGYNDFNTNFSIITYKEIGDPIAIMAIPMIDIINEAFWKWRWILRRSKAPGTDYNVDSLEKIADSIFCDTDGRQNRIQKTIQWLDSSSNRLWGFPIGEDGRPIMMSNTQLNIEVENGLSNNFMKYWETMTVTWDKLIDMLIGHSDLRQGNSAQPRQSMNNEFKALEYSQNSTSYIPDMITFFCRQSATRSGIMVQDIIQYRDYDTLAYKFLQDLVGDEALDKIENMGKTALHRYGINVESLNQVPKLMKLAQRIDFAIANGKLTNAQALLIEDIKSPQLAFRTLAYFESRNDKIKQKQAMEMQKAQAEEATALKKLDLQARKMEIDAMLANTKITADATIQKTLITQQGGLAKTIIKKDGDIEHIYHQVNADFQAQTQILNDTGKTTLPPPPPPIPSGPAPGQAPPPPFGIEENPAQEASVI